jgi:cholesterol oxidase
MKQTTSVGVRFTETMRGHLALGDRHDHDAAEIEGHGQGQTLEFTVTITFDDLNAMIADPNHAGRITGTVDAPLLGAGLLTVEDGVFELFKTDPGAAQCALMVYRMLLRGGGKSFRLKGTKTLRDDGGFDMWRDSTTLAVDIEDVGGAVVARGIARISVSDFVRQLTTMRAVNAPSAASGLRAVSRFGLFFQNRMRSIYGRMFAPRERLTSLAGRQRRALRCGEGERIPIRTQDGVELKLTRFKGGDKGPVLLTPGFGTSSLAYLIDTVDTNLPEYLFERGYDVWLLDYRASPDLKSATTQFTLDDIARYDYPAAVGAVRERTGAPSIQMMAHCVGSLTFQMAQTLGLQGVRSAICSQLTLHPKLPMLNQIKGRLYLANLIKAASFDTLTTTYTDSLAERAFDLLLRLYPSRYQRSANPVLHRILFLYGDVIKLEKLNRATYEAIPEMFGPANLTTFLHLSQIARAGHAVGPKGEDCYLPHADRLKMPITFLHGAENHLFLPHGSEETMRFLAERNGADLYNRHVIQNYAHMDCFLGRDADRDVYPIVASELEKYSSH